MLTVLNALPTGLLDAPAADLYRILPGPTLIHLPGRRSPALFVSVLQHGNEMTGLLAVQAVLRSYHGATRPRALSVYIGNVAAAREGLRRLDEQPDYNRVWPGADTAGLPEHVMTAEVVDQMRVRQVFASIGIAVAATQLSYGTHRYHDVIAEHVTLYGEGTRLFLQRATAAMRAAGADPVTAAKRAVAILDGQVTRQAVVLAYNHIFELAAALFVLGIPLVLLLKHRAERVDMGTVAAD